MDIFYSKMYIVMYFTLIGAVESSLQTFPFEVFERLEPIRFHFSYNSVAHRNLAPDKYRLKILHQIGKSEEELPVCRARSVCSVIELSGAPRAERQCRCAGSRICPTHYLSDDGQTISEKTRLLKMCEPVKILPKCRYFRDPTWTIMISTTNATEQTVHCHCPKNAVTYLTKRQTIRTDYGQIVYKYSFACSPQSKMRCQRKEPCRLFTVRSVEKSEAMDEVNISNLCVCEHGHRCPHHHRDTGVLPVEPSLNTDATSYSGYCVPLSRLSTFSTLSTHHRLVAAGRH